MSWIRQVYITLLHVKTAWAIIGGGSFAETRVLPWQTSQVNGLELNQLSRINLADRCRFRNIQPQFSICHLNCVYVINPGYPSSIKTNELAIIPWFTGFLWAVVWRLSSTVINGQKVHSPLTLLTDSLAMVVHIDLSYGFRVPQMPVQNPVATYVIILSIFYYIRVNNLLQSGI